MQMSIKLSLKILDKRLTADGNDEFLIQYKTGDQIAEEWKLSQDIQDFQSLIQDYDQEMTYKMTNGFANGTNGTVAESEEEVLPEVEEVVKTEQQMNGFDRGFHPFKILGAKEDDNNGLMFLVMFREDLTTADLIPNHVLHEKCPQLLIKYYEKNTLWKRY